MSRHRSKWITAGLLAATAGPWTAAFTAQAYGIDWGDVSDCRSLGIMFGCWLFIWLVIRRIVVPWLRRITGLLQETREWQNAQGGAWSAYLEGEDAVAGGQVAGLRPAGRADVA